MSKSKRVTIEVYLQCSVLCRVNATWDPDDETAEIHSIAQSNGPAKLPGTDCLDEYELEEIDNKAREAAEKGNQQ